MSTTPKKGKQMDREILENQKTIKALATRMELLFGTPRALKPEAKARMMELQDRTLFYLKELELQGQRFKIHNMQQIIGMLMPDA